MFCINLCHLLWAFAAFILWKTQYWDIFARVRTAKCIASCNHDGSLEDNSCVPLFKLKFLIATLRHIFVCQSLQTFTEKVTFKVPFRKISWEKIHFCVLKKETFISKGRKNKWILPNNTLSSSPVDIILLRTFFV